MACGVVGGVGCGTDVCVSADARSSLGSSAAGGRPGVCLSRSLSGVGAGVFSVQALAPASKRASTKAACFILTDEMRSAVEGSLESWGKGVSETPFV